MPNLVLDDKAKELAVALTQELVQIPSPYGEEGAVAKYLYQILVGLGFETSLQDVEGERKNVVGILRGRGEGKNILLQGHMDTMPTYGMDEPFSGRSSNGRIYGRGTTDMKGALACMIAAADLVSRTTSTRLGDIILAFTVDEESQKKGIYRLVEDLPPAYMGICGEPTSLKLGIGQKGNISIRINTKGKQSHGSTPENGINAILEMVKLLKELQSFQLESVYIDGVGWVYGTINPGVIQGGHHFMFVPDSCSVWIDRRLVPGGVDAEGAIIQIEKIIDELRKKDAQFAAEVYIERQDWNWPPIMKRTLKSALVKADSQPVTIMKNVHRSIRGTDPELIVMSGWTEIDFLNNEAGIPTLLYGPGNLSEAHSATESVEIEQLYQATIVYASAATEVITTS